MTYNKLATSATENLLSVLKIRFETYANRHKHLEWDKIETKLRNNPEKMWSLQEMENTGGEPDVVAYDENTKEYIFFDCAEESPIGRRSCCYDQNALEKRKANKPTNSAQNMANAMGITILTTTDYHFLQQLGKFDTKTSSWIATPNNIRELGGALFGDFRFNTVFIYHNGAESYYAARGFRGVLRV